MTMVYCSSTNNRFKSQYRIKDAPAHGLTLLDLFLHKDLFSGLFIIQENIQNFFIIILKIFKPFCINK